MKLNWKRTMTTLVGIVFMVLLMTCVFVGKDTSLSYLAQVASEKSGSWHASVYDVNEEQYNQIKELNYIEETAVSGTYGYSYLPQSVNEACPYLLVKGYSESCFDWMNIKLESGRLPENDSEVVLSARALADGGDISVGDVIELDCFKRYLTGINYDIESTFFPFFNLTVYPGKSVEVPQNFAYLGDTQDFKETHESIGYKKTVTVVGFISAPSFETANSGGYAALTYMENSMEHVEKANVTIMFDLDKLDSGYGYVEDLERITGSYDNFECNDLLLAFTANSSDNTINVIVTFVMVFFILFIMVASVILIYNVFNLSFEERSRYLGMLSSVGATKKQKKSSVYYEAFSLWLIALPVGILGGMGIVKVAMEVLQPYIADIVDFSGTDFIHTTTVPLEVSGKALLFIVLVSGFTVALSAWLPARKIGKIGPIESIRGNMESKKKEYKRNDFFIKKSKPEALVAVNNLKRQKGKTSSIIRAIASFMVVFLVTAFGANGINKMVHYRLVEDVTLSIHTDGWDYVLSEEPDNAKIYQALKEEIMADKGVEKVQEWYCNMWTGTVKNDILSQEYWEAYHTIADLYYPEDLTEEQFQELTEGNYNTFSIIGVDQETYEKIAEKSECDLDLVKDTSKPSVLVYQNTELSTENMSFDDYKPERYQFFQLEHMTDKKIGDTMPLSIYNAQKEEVEEFDVTVAGYATNESLKEYATIHSEGLWLIINTDTAQKMQFIMNEETDENNNGITRELHIKLNGTETDLIEKLQTLANEENYAFGFAKAGESQTLKTVAEAVACIIDILAVCFIILTSIICILNIYNSIWGRAAARQQEFAILTSLGMTKKQRRKMLFCENIGLFFKGILWACVIAFPIIYLLKTVLSVYFGRIELEFPVGLFVLAIIFSGVWLFGVTSYCYRTRENENIFEQLRNENVS